MNTIELTKYQASKVNELMCPNCNSDLVDLGKLDKYCRACGIVYNGRKEKPQCK